MHVLLIEAALTGHHSVYLERIAAAFIRAGHVVTATVLQRHAQHPGLQRMHARFGDAFHVMQLQDEEYESAVCSRLGQTGRELALRKLFGQAYRTICQVKPVDYVFLPYLDYCLYALGLLGSPFGATQW